MKTNMVKVAYIKRTLFVGIILLVLGGLYGCKMEYKQARKGEKEETVTVTGSVTKIEKELVTEAKPAITFYDADDNIYVTSDRVNLRDNYNLNSKVIASVNKGQCLKRIKYSDEWSKVIYQDKECYISSKYFTTTAVEMIPETESVASNNETNKVVEWNPEWKYADQSAIHSGAATLYYAQTASPKGKTVCVNAGHGTKGGESVKTFCHPDGTKKVTDGSTKKGETKASAVAYGTTMNDGTPEYKVTLKMSMVLKDQLLAAGYHVLMIRESDDVQLDNIARTVIANKNADCHIAIHYDSTQNDKGAFFMSVPNVESYRSMEPVASYWKEHNRLGESVINGLRNQGIKIFSGGSMGMDLTQTSYSTVPSIDLEVGDCASDYSESTLRGIADGIVKGLDQFFTAN